MKALQILWIAVVAGQSVSPNSFHRFESKLHGFTLQVPDGFDEIPVEPGEKTVLHRFAERKKANEFSGEIWVLTFPKSAEPPVEAWAKERLMGWQISKATKLATESGVTPSLFRLQAPAGGPKGFAYTIAGESRTLCLVGFGPPSGCADCEARFEFAARSIREKAASNPLDVDWESFYLGNIYRGVPYRIEARKRLAQGWKADDTENFLVVFSTPDIQLVGKVKRDIETIRSKYMEVFPPASPIDALSTVRICRDLDEFRKYSGAPPAMAGYWNPKAKELVFFDASALPAAAKREEMSYAVLYHEAFHQYAHYAAGEVEMHSWFNEGMGDYFSGSVIGKNAKRVARVEANTFRLPTAKQIVEQGKWIPLAQFTKMEQAAYYADYARCYAQGWALIYFLLESREAKKNAAWSQIVKIYFERLRATKSKQAALDAAFAGVDFAKLDEACKAFVAEIEEPK